jgi:hypothetical protein
LFLRVSSRCLAPSALRFLPCASCHALPAWASSLALRPCASRLALPALRSLPCASGRRSALWPSVALLALAAAWPRLRWPRRRCRAILWLRPRLLRAFAWAAPFSGRALSGRVPLMLCCPAYGLPVGKQIAESLPTFAFLMFASASRPSSSPALKLHTVVPKRRPPGLLPFRAAAP